MKPLHGTRYEFVLAQDPDAPVALYDVDVATPNAVTRVRLKLEGDLATVLSRDGALEPATESQLVALARTLARHRDGGPWPRRVTRWRQQGVR